MQLFFVDGGGEGSELEISGDEAHHLLHVLRKKKGDVIQVLDGKGHKIQLKIIEIKAHSCRGRVLSIEVFGLPGKSVLHLAISPLKSPDRMEWLIEKGTELGVQSFQFIMCKHTFKVRVNLKRMEKIVQSAIKQSQRGILPKVLPPVTFTEFLNKDHQEYAGKFIAYCGEWKKKPLPTLAPEGSFLGFVGPEGDFTEEEVFLAAGKGIEVISLGNMTLRAETAGIYLASKFCV